MFDWTDDFITQACYSYPSLMSYILVADSYGDHDELLDFLLALEPTVNGQPIPNV